MPPTNTAQEGKGHESVLEDAKTAAKVSGDELVDSLIGAQVDNYEIQFAVGKGAYGKVYKARDVHLGRFVALKFLHPGLHERHREALLREAQAIAALGKHPAIVQIYAWGQWEDRNYFALEFVGSNAGILLRAHPGGIAIELAIRIAAECAEGLAYAHRNGVLHRDIKPANILLELDGGMAKLADFGVARLLSDTVEHAGIAGTPAYLSPEVADGGQGDQRSDLFSLGVTLYEMLTGTYPFTGSTTDEMRAAIATGVPKPIRNARPELAPIVAEVVHRAIAHNPDDRYLDANEFAEDLRSLLQGDAPLAGFQQETVDTCEDARLRAYRSAEDAKRSAADRLMAAEFQAHVDDFREGETAERAGNYVKAMACFEKAEQGFVRVEGAARNALEGIREMRSARHAMEQRRDEAAAVRASTLAATQFQRAVEYETNARAQDDVRLARDAYREAEAAYAEAADQARAQGTSGIDVARQRTLDAAEAARTAGAPKRAAAVWAKAESALAQLAQTDGNAASLVKRYAETCALYLQAARVAEAVSRYENECEPRPPIEQAGITLVWIPPGRFAMGDDAGDASEGPRHTVVIERGFWFGRCPVTQAQWQRIMGRVPSGFRDQPDAPVENVSWSDAQAFCERLSAREGSRFRLPTESEWEYACRAGTDTRYYFGDDSGPLHDHAWYPRNAQGRTHDVGKKRPNPWDLYDLYGNVCEWCADAWRSRYDEPEDTAPDAERVARGGSWCLVAGECRSAARPWHAPPDMETDFVGLRVVREDG